MTNRYADLTPLADWFDGYEPVTLASGKVVGLRPLDVLAVIREDGSVPNILLPVIQTQMGQKVDVEPTEVEGLDDLMGMSEWLDRLIAQCLVFPRLVETEAEVQARKGILLRSISLTDKMSIFVWAMGGQAAIDASKRFLEQQSKNLASVSNGRQVQQPTSKAGKHS